MLAHIRVMFLRQMNLYPGTYKENFMYSVSS